MRRLLVGVLLTVAMGAWSGPTVIASAATPAPTLSVMPSTGLVDGRFVHGVARGFAPDRTVAIVQCQAGSVSPDRCPGFLQAQHADPAGVVEFDLALSRSLPTDAGPAPGATSTTSDVIDCADAGACVVLVYDYDSGAFATAPVTFAAAPLLPIRLDLDGLGGSLPIAADGSVTVTGTIACATTTDVVLVATVSTPSTTAHGQVDPLPCSPTPTTWSVVLTARGVGLEPGPAQVRVDASSPPAGASGSGVATEVTLTGAGGDADATYYLALGDSLVTGFAAPPGQGYVDDLLAYYRQQDPHLRVVNLGCSSEVSAGLIANGLCSFAGQSQLQAAESFMAAHPGQVKLITIDIGGNDVVFCGTAPLDQQADCLNQALAGLDVNMATILGRLRAAAGPDVAVLGMNYFNPFLNHWLGGEGDKAFAHLTSAALGLVNQHLEASFAAHGVPVADVAGAFRVDDYDTQVDSPYGTIPVNVALACRWLDIGCVAGSVGSFGDDANAEGYRVIAGEFIKLLPRLAGDGPTPPHHRDLSGLRPCALSHRPVRRRGRRPDPSPPVRCRRFPPSPAERPTGDRQTRTGSSFPGTGRSELLG